MKSIYRVPKEAILFAHDDTTEQVRARLQKWIEGSYRGTADPRYAYSRLIRLGVATSPQGEVNQHDLNKVIQTIRTRFRKNVIGFVGHQTVTFYTKPSLRPERLSFYAKELFGLSNLNVKISNHQHFGLFRRVVFEVTPSKVILDVRALHLPALKSIKEESENKSHFFTSTLYKTPELNERTGRVSIVIYKDKEAHKKYNVSKF